MAHPDDHPNPVIVFEVMNTSKEALYLPVEITPGFITATATAGERQYTYDLAQGERTTGPISCRKLAPGETAYLHPAYSFIDLKWKNGLPDGKYAVATACRNIQTKGTIWARPGEKQDVTAWTGELRAPAVELILAPKR